MTIHQQLSQARDNLAALQREMRDAQLEALRTAIRGPAGNYSPGMSTILADAAAPYVAEIQAAQATISRLDWECRDEINQTVGALAD